MPDFGLKRENHDARLPGEFYPPMAAQQVSVQPRMIHVNVEAAALNLAVLPPQIVSPAPVLPRSLSS